MSVPAGGKQTEEDLWQRHKAERGVWSEPMLLANIYLDPLDWLMAGIGFEMVRYADDVIVL